MRYIIDSAGCSRHQPGINACLGSESCTFLDDPEVFQFLPGAYCCTEVSQCQPIHNDLGNTFACVAQCLGLGWGTSSLVAGAMLYSTLGSSLKHFNRLDEVQFTEYPFNADLIGPPSLPWSTILHKVTASVCCRGMNLMYKHQHICALEVLNQNA
jgi:hypothetical protein